MKLFLSKKFYHFRMGQGKFIPLLILFCVIFSLRGYTQNNSSRIISGQVTSPAGVALQGVSIKIKGSTTGTATDANGRYSITVSDPQAVLQFSYLGYISKEEAVQGRGTLNIQLSEDTKVLTEVVVLGYGTTDKRSFSGAASTIDVENLPKAANTSINALIQGRASGVSVSQGSAQPGGRYSISIRGRGAPLYVVDGVPLFNNGSSEPSIQSFSNSAEIGFGGGINRDPLNAVNPDDIESVTLLKDASTAAIYGSAASNGVVLITTKKGKADGRVTTQYSTNVTFQTPKKYFDFLDAKGFMEYSNRLTKEQYLYNNSLAPYGTLTTTNVYTAPYTQIDIDAAGTGTDWVGLMVRDGMQTEHNLSLSGGTDKTRIYSSFNYNGNKGAIENSKTELYRGKINVSQQIVDRLTASVDLTIAQSNSQNASTGGGGATEKFNSLQAAYAFSPTVGVYDAAGNFNKSTNTLVTNPAAYLIIDDNSRDTRFLAAPKLEFNATNNLTLTARGGISRSSGNRRFYLPALARNYLLPEGMAQLSTSVQHNYNAEGFANYRNNFGDHGIDLVAGAGYYTAFSESMNMQGYGFFSDAFSYNNIGLASNKDKSFLGSNRSQDQNKISQWARAVYNYKSRYSLSLSARRDGASNFARNKKYAIFPSVSGNWNIAEEAFFSGVKPVSTLKLRASYASTGDPGNLNAVALLSTGGGQYLIGNTYYTGVAQSQLENPDLTWETYWETNLGLDFGLFNDRITGAIELYQRDRSDILSSAPLPVNNSINTFNTNEGGKTRTRGYELLINSTNIRSQSFRWETGFNVSHNEGRTLERSPFASPLRSWQSIEDRNGKTFGWKTMGILKQGDTKPAHMPNARLGNLLYQDINSDGLLNESDVVFLGYSNPKWRGGLQNRFDYKQFDLTVDMYGELKAFGGNNNNTYAAVSRLAQDRLNVTTNIDEIWRTDNPDGFRPGIAANPYTSPAGSDFQTDYINFVRLRNITMGYTFNPKKVVRTARIALDLQNVAIFTNYKGFDPEINEGNPYPQVLQTSIRLQVGF